MANKSATRKNDNFLRNVIIGFAAFIVVLAAVLVLNARSLGFIGTVDGERIPMEQFYFQRQLVIEQLGFDAWMMTETQLSEITFQALVDIYIVAGWADEFNVVMTPEQISLAQGFADAFREDFTWDDVDQIAGMGFSRAGFNSFIEFLVLEDAVRTAIVEGIEIPSDDELYEAFEEFLLENRELHYVPYVYLVEVASMAAAESLLTRVVMGDNIREVIIENLGLDISADELESVNIFDYDISQEMLNAARETAPDSLAIDPLTELGVFEMINGNFAFFVVDRIDYDPPSMEEWEEWYIASLGWEYFDNRLALARSQVNASRNQRVFNSFD